MSLIHKSASNNKHHVIFSTSYWAFIQMLFLQVGALAVAMYITRMLSAAEYGLIPLINSLVILLVVFVGLGLPGSMARFLASQDTKRNQKLLVIRALIGAAPWVIFSTIIIVMLFPYIVRFLNEPGLLELKWLFVCVLFLELFRLFLEKACHGTRNMRISASFSGWASLSVVIVTVPVVWHDASAYMVFTAKIFALLVPSVRAAWSLRKVLTDDSSVLAEQLPDIKEMMRYGLPLAVISLSGFGFVQLDMLLLAYYGNSATVGFYSVGVLLLIKLIELSKVIGFGVSPFYAKKNGDEIERATYFITGMRYALIVAAPLAILIAIEADSILGYMFGSTYAQAGDSMVVLSAYFIMASVLAIASPVLDFGGKAKIRAYGAIVGALTNLILNIVLIPRYGAVGAAIATVCGYSILFIVTISNVFNIIPLEALKNKSLLRLITFVAPLILISMIVIKLVQDETSLLGNLLFLMIVYPVLLYWSGVVTKSEIDLVRRNLLRK